jgi:hypothetical protein
MKSLQTIIDMLDGSPIRTIVLNMQEQTVTILHNNQPIHGVTFDQIESLYIMEAVAPDVVKVLVDQGVFPRSSWIN